MTRSSRTGIAIATGVVAALLVAAVGLLFFRSDDTARGDLSEAVRSGDIDHVRAQLEAGADPDEPRVMGLTPLMRAAVRNDVEIVTLLLGAGADPAAEAPEGLTAAHVAAQADAVDSLGVLVGAGADLGAVSSNGMNVLHHAADLGSVGVIEFAAGQGMDLDARSEVITQGHGHPRDRGATALGIASRAGQMEAVEALLAHGANVDAVSAAGHTPLLLAVFSGYSPEVVSALIAAGADPRIEASCQGGGCFAEDGNALDWARFLNQVEMVPLLESALQN